MDITTLALAKAYTDSQRLAYVETGKAVVFQQTEFNIPYDDTDGLAFVEMLPSPFTLFLEKEYEVVWNGDPYKFVCKDCTEEFGDPSVYIGGRSVFGEEDTEAPFTIIFANYEGEPFVGVYVPGTTEDVTVSLLISTEIETIHPIDPKYLPGAVLPVVEISNIENLTEEEQATLTAYADQRTPILVKLFDGGVLMASGVFLFLDPGNGQKIYALAGLCSIMYVDSSWSVIME